MRVYDVLSQNELVHTAEDFGVNWCGKCKSWYAERKHARRDFGVAAATACYRAIHHKLEQVRKSRLRIGAVLDDEVEALEAARDLVQRYLLEHHSISAVLVDEKHELV
ncbi:hypothetical protein [uncultured Roseovarius sp.]|uniref:hypothetical protein n=1 Tax=uncultured Roseovarius sp. TaxID=293344 RepID=UPI0025E63614|nr:hypothetical protein [uncultured Roseovarius sp.]